MFSELQSIEFDFKCVSSFMASSTEPGLPVPTEFLPILILKENLLVGGRGLGGQVPTLIHSTHPQFLAWPHSFGTSKGWVTAASLIPAVHYR